MANDEYITIKEAAKLAGVNISTIYKNIKQLKSKSEQIGAKQIKYVEKSSIEAFFAVNIKQKQMEANGSDSLQMEANGSNSPTMEANGSEWKQNKLDLKDLIKEALTEQQSQLMKPIEEQALYRLGILENEVKHLNAEKEVLRLENEELKESIKALPGPGDIEKLKSENDLLKEQIKALPDPSELEEKDNVFLLLKEEHDALKKQIEILPGKPEEVNNILMNNADNLKALQQDNASLKATSEIRLEKLKEQAEREKQELQAQLSRAMEEKENALKAMSQATEKEKLEIVEAWKKELEQAKRPWYKFW